MGAEPWGCLHHTVCESRRAAWGVEAHGVLGHIVCSRVCSTTKCAPCAAKRAVQRSMQHPTACSTLQRAAQHPTACRAECSTLQHAAPYSLQLSTLLQHRTYLQPACSSLQLAGLLLAPPCGNSTAQHRPLAAGWGSQAQCGVAQRGRSLQPVGPGCSLAGRVLGAASPARSP